jgi:hypothetical protein
VLHSCKLFVYILPVPQDFCEAEYKGDEPINFAEVILRQATIFKVVTWVLLIALSQVDSQEWEARVERFEKPAVWSEMPICKVGVKEDMT